MSLGTTITRGACWPPFDCAATGEMPKTTDTATTAVAGSMRSLAERLDMPEILAGTASQTEGGG